MVSQWKYQTEFEFASKQILDDTLIGRHYSLNEENLPHIITSVEKKLGHDISSSPCMHLIVYIPPCQSSPLHIYKKNGKNFFFLIIVFFFKYFKLIIGERSMNNIDSFISSKWGGVIIYNQPENICIEQLENENPIEFDVNSNDVMQVMLFLLRKLMNIQNTVTSFF